MVKKRKKNRRSGESEPAAVVIATPPAPPPRRHTFWIIGSVLLAAFLAAFLLLRSQNDPAPAQVTAVASAPASATVAEARYVGGAECASCHASQVDAWKGSHHDLAMKVADAQSVLGNFSNTKFTYAGVTSTFSKRDGKFFVNTDGPDGKLADFEIKYTFGVEPLQQYLIEFPGGRKQALSHRVGLASKRQGRAALVSSVSRTEIKAGDWLHWTAPGQNWNFTCAECHSTNLRKNYDRQDRHVQHDVVGDQRVVRGVSWPGVESLSWAQKPGDWKALDANQGACSSARRAPQRRMAAGRSDAPPRIAACRVLRRASSTPARVATAAALASPTTMCTASHRSIHIGSSLLGAPMYWADGQMRDEVYNWGSFAQSKMHAQGVTCSDCHNPHSLKLKARATPCAPSVISRRTSTRRSTRTMRWVQQLRSAPAATCRRRPTWLSIRDTIIRCACRVLICP